MDTLGEGQTPSDDRGAAEIFIALVTLTEVLGCYLEHMYCISKSLRHLSETSTSGLEQLLTNWEQTLGQDVRRVIVRGIDLKVPGAANFRLSYLAVKLLLRQLQLNLDRTSSPQEDSNSHHYIQAQRAAEEIVHLTQELDEVHLYGFWLPLNACSLTSATTFLLRSALRAKPAAHIPPLEIAKEMIATLQSHRRNYSWDLADDCLTTCCGIPEKIEARSPPTSPRCPDLQEFMDVDASVLDDVHRNLGIGFDFDF